MQFTDGYNLPYHILFLRSIGEENLELCIQFLLSSELSMLCRNPNHFNGSLAHLTCT